MRLIGGIACAALLGACASSPPTRFYVLDPVPSSQQRDDAPGAAVQIASVHIPPALDRREMVQEASPASLQISDQHRWAAPFADMTQTTLTQDLIRRLPEGKVILPRTAPPPGTYEITVDILQFELTSSGEVVFEGGWSLYRLGSDVPLRNQHVSLRERPKTPEYASQARTMSEILGRFADEIVRSLPAGNS